MRRSVECECLTCTAYDEGFQVCDCEEICPLCYSCEEHCTCELEARLALVLVLEQRIQQLERQGRKEFAQMLLESLGAGEKPWVFDGSGWTTSETR